MTPNEITSLIASNLEKELDFAFKLQLMERVKYWRSRLLANSVQKSPQQRKFFRQTVFLKMTPQANVPNAPYVAETVAVSDPVPQVVRAGDTMFDYVGGVDGKSPFREILPGTDNYLSTGKFAHKFPGYKIAGNYIYIDKAELPLIRVEAIFDDPQAAEQLSCECQGVACDTWNIPFPVSGDILQLIVQSILQIDYNRPDRTDTPEVKPTL
jgi:hypothetical protein